MNDPSPQQLPNHFSLRWNNFQTNLSLGFTALLRDEDFVDVTLGVEGHFLQAHKLVLSISSPYFRELFKVNPCKHPIVILKDVGFNEMTGLLQFIYQGEVSIAQEKLPDFLRTAELLQIKGLTGTEAEDSTESWKQPRVDAARKPSHHSKTRFIEDTQVPSTEYTSSTLSRLDNISPSFDLLETNEVHNTEDCKPVFEDSVGETGIQQPSLNLDLSDDISSDQGNFEMTSRGTLQLVRNGYVYHCNRQTEEKIFWKCAEYNRTRCRSRCISVGGIITVTHAAHNHVVKRKCENKKRLSFIQSQIPNPYSHFSVSDITQSENM